jgi:hypothetical protein
MDLLNDLRTDKALHRNILKFATMLAVSKAMSLQDAKFLVNTVATLVGFTAYHLVTKKIQLPFDNPDLKAVTNTWMKVGTMLVVSRLYKGEKLSQEFLMDSALSLAGFNVADLVLPRVMPDFGNDLMQKIATDVAVVLIMTVTKTLLTGGQVTPKLLVQASWTIAGFVLYDLIEELTCE